MNFFKQKILGIKKEQQKKQQSNLKNEQEQIPIQVLTQIFQKSAKFISQSNRNISDQDKLIIYGLYKQATIGDCNTPKPNMLDFVGKSKWTSWNNNKGMTKSQSMKNYISKSVQIDPNIQRKMKNQFQGIQQNNQLNEKQVKQNVALSTTGLKMVQPKDYSSSYSHPYFKKIQQNIQLKKQDINKQLLLQKNNNPKCYALHFAIDKQRIDLVKLFLEFLSIEQIEQMKDQQGMGIQQYAELIQNQEIIQLIKFKLQKN